MSETDDPVASIETDALDSVEVPQEQRTWGMAAHLAALCGFIGVPLGFILGPLVVWLIKKDTMPFVNEQGKEAMNFQITAVIAALCCIPLMLILIGFLLILVVGIAALVFTIIAAVKTSRGEHFRYPFSLRLIK